MRILLEGGQLPTETFLQGLKDSMTNQRPLTDNLVIAAPDVVDFSIDLIYYISSERQGEAESIKSAIKQALNDYTVKLAKQIGKDIIPDEIVKICLDNGAKRIVLASPEYQIITQAQVAKCQSIQAEFGGVEQR